jgi:hypothetical protein
MCVLGCELAGSGARRPASPAATAAAATQDRHQDPDRGRQGRAAQARPSQGKAIPSSVLAYSVADPGCLHRIRIFSIPDPGSASKN